MPVSSIKAEFCAKISDSEQWIRLFDHLPEVYFFGKDQQGRFVFANQSIVNALGLSREEDLLGKTDYDFFDRDLAERYREEDRLIMATGEPLLDRVWLVPNPDGTLHWYLSSKRPLFDSQKQVVGIAGVMRDFDKAGEAVGPYRKLSPVLSHVQAHFRESIAVDELADLIGASLSTLERNFKNLFGITPATYITRVRLHAARRALLETTQSINDIALDCGFYDQSHFTKKFRATFGTTPSDYRKNHRPRLGSNVGGV